jgi:flagellar motor protein MotB
MSSRIRKKESSAGGGAPWLTTLCDLMQLLLTFFVLLFSMSNVDAEKFANVTTSIQEAFIGFQAGYPKMPMTVHHYRWDRGKYEKKRLERLCTP